MSNTVRIEHRNGGELLYIALHPDSVWVRSEFPHPLVTVDYDTDNRVIGISAVGSQIVKTLLVYWCWFANGTGDTKRLVRNLSA